MACSEAILKALTLYQPWASLVSHRVKTIETRSWSTRYRGPLAIHAAARYPAAGECPPGLVMHDMLGDLMYFLGEPFTEEDQVARGLPPDGDLIGFPLPLGAVIATAELVDVVPILAPGEWLDPGWAKHVSPSREGGPLWLWLGPSETENASTGRPTWRHEVIEDQRPYGDYTPGRFAWLLENIAWLAEPVPARGHQQLWEWAA